MGKLSMHQPLDLRIRGEAASAVTRVPQFAIDRDVELPGVAGSQLDLADPFALERVPHTEGLRPIASGTAVFDQDLHAFSFDAELRNTPWTSHRAQRGAATTPGTARPIIRFIRLRYLTAQ
jgi:hypothetical protein